MITLSALATGTCVSNWECIAKSMCLAVKEGCERVNWLRNRVKRVAQRKCLYKMCCPHGTTGDKFANWVAFFWEFLSQPKRKCPACSDRVELWVVSPQDVVFKSPTCRTRHGSAFKHPSSSLLSNQMFPNKSLPVDFSPLKRDSLLLSRLPLVVCPINPKSPCSENQWVFPEVIPVDQHQSKFKCLMNSREYKSL